MKPVRARRIRRVLVALDASPGSVAAARAAARVAAVLEAELTGLFVEDRDLLRLSESSQARQVGFLTATAEPVGGREMERLLRAQAARARRLLTHLAEREGVTCTFRVLRGRVTAEVAAEAGSEDLVSVGRIGWSHGHRRRLGSTARALLERRQTHVLLLERGAAVRSPVAVVFDGSPASLTALRLAVELARPAAGSLIVLVTGREGKRLAMDELGPRAESTRFESLARLTARTLTAAAEACRPGLLLLPVGGPGLTGDDLLELLGGLRCPVLAVS